MKTKQQRAENKELQTKETTYAEAKLPFNTKETNYAEAKLLLHSYS